MIIRRQCFSGADDGYALPAVLFLITILCLLAASVVTGLSFARRQGITEVASVKAEFAAQSGIAMLLNGIHNFGDLNEALNMKHYSYRFPDGSSAEVNALAWGGYLFVGSSGEYAQQESKLAALIADSPGELFSNALVFANPKHQLVFAGESTVHGNVVVGERGVTTGGLKGRRRPSNVPVDGSITRSSLVLDRGPSAFLERTLLNSVTDGPLIHHGTELVLDGLHSATHVFVQNDVSITGVLAKVDNPLYVVIEGDVIIEPQTHLHGLVMINAEGKVTIRGGAHLSGVIIMGNKSIEIEEKGYMSGQFIAPTIVTEENTHLTYPSWLYSGGVGVFAREMSLREGSIVEGTVSIDESSPESLGEFHVHPGARVVGAVHSLPSLTFDGHVVGSIVTTDFYFYEAPTRYHGWLRAGQVDRGQLPEGFLVPITEPGEFELQILEWLE